MSDDLKPHIERLRNSGLRPTKQRLSICKVLFSRPETFHFTIEKLKKIIEKKRNMKVSLATLYNTVHAFKKNGYLKEISLKGNKIFFDTNVKMHHHFFDENTEELFDINSEDIFVDKIPKAPNGKKTKGIEVLVRVADENQNQNQKK